MKKIVVVKKRIEWVDYIKYSDFLKIIKYCNSTINKLETELEYYKKATEIALKLAKEE